MGLEQYKKYQLYLGKNLLAVDFGTKSTGLSTFTPGQDLYPLPRGALKIKDQGPLVDKITQMVLEEGIEVIILGIPYASDGHETSMARKVKKFGKMLMEKSKLKNTAIYFQDETLSSYEAEERMKNSPLYNFKVDKDKIDTLAACIILEDFIRQ